MCAQLLSHVLLFATPRTIAHQAPLSMRFSRQEYWSGVVISSSRGSSPSRDWTQVPCISWICRWILYHHTTGEVPYTAMSMTVQISLRYLVSFHLDIYSEVRLLGHLLFNFLRHLPISIMSTPFASTTAVHKDFNFTSSTTLIFFWYWHSRWMWGAISLWFRVLVP